MSSVSGSSINVRVLGERLAGSSPKGPNGKISDYQRNEANRTSDTASSQGALRKGSFSCPICHKPFRRALYLSSHIEEFHSPIKKSKQEVDEPTKRSSLPSTPSPRKKTINLDLFDNLRGFGLSDMLTSSPELDQLQTDATSPTPARRTQQISRKHWQTPSSGTTICSSESCSKQLNVKNGIVNCRLCGKLFCNEHSHFRIKLINGKSGTPEYNSSKDGQWCRCCKFCYMNKPDLIAGTIAFKRDLTGSFKDMRTSEIASKKIERSVIQKRFIRLVNLHVKSYLHKKIAENNRRIRWFPNSPNGDIFIEEEKNIVGIQNWQKDSDISNCNICLTKFGLLIRKHHCRLCGRIVCDDPYGDRLQCSIVVPLGAFLQKLSNLNYSREVRQNLNLLYDSKSADLLIRCCLRCKNDLLFDWKNSTYSLSVDPQIKGVFISVDQFLIMKARIQISIARLKILVNNNESENVEKLNICRSNAMSHLKQLESSISNFKNSYFISSNKLTVSSDFVQYEQLITNVYNSMCLYLQNSLLEVKSLNDKLQKMEYDALRIAKLNVNDTEAVAMTGPPKKSMTKKQIRELTETALVLNEQKFLIEAQIEDYTKHRRFGELGPLVENKKELEIAILNVQQELGENSFTT